MKISKTIRFQLLVAVNTTMALVLIGFLILDYHREIADRVAEKRLALEEEAKTLLPAVLRMQPYGHQAVQQYVDDVCSRMRDAHSPGHHIAVESDGAVVQALAHHRSSPAMIEAMQAAARLSTYRSQLGNEELVVGVDRQGPLTVYVAEHLTNIQKSVRIQVILRLAGIALAGLVAAVAINVVFLRMVARPLQSLVATVQQIAHGQLGVRSGAFNSEEFTHLAHAINTMSSSLAEADRQRRNEMAKARCIQEHLLPDGVEVPGIALAHLYQPATDVAGDYYDVVSLPDGKWLLCIADVTGHGVPAAMSAAMLKTLLMHATEHHADLDQILRLMNQRFTAVSLTEDFASMLLSRWNPATDVLEYASAGHESAWFLPAAGTLRELPSTGGLLGIYEEGTWETKSLPVSPEDRLMLVTDGAAEALSDQGAVFGRDRLVGEFTRYRRAATGEVIHQIDSALKTHRRSRTPTDDITIVVIEFVPQRSHVRTTCSAPCSNADSLEIDLTRR